MSEKCINIERNGKIHRLLDIAISIGYIIGIFKVYGREREFGLSKCVLSDHVPHHVCLISL